MPREFRSAPPASFRGTGAAGAYVENTAEWLERHPVPVLSALAALYLFATMYLAHLKPLWDDEFFTLYIAQGGFKETWAALHTGADQHPPLFYWLTFLCMKPFGFTHVMFRLPEILGFLTMLFSLFFIVSPRTNNLTGYFAMLFPCLTKAYYYAAEGRGYGLVLACAASGYLAWQGAAAGKSRRITIPLFGFCLGAAVCCHYYGILVLIPFGLGELVRFLERRRPDFPLWVAFAAPLVPLATFFPVIRSSRGYAAHFWAVPAIGKIADTFFLVFSSAGTTLFYVVVTIFLFCCLSEKFRRTREERFGLGTPPFNLSETAVFVGLMALPAFGYVVARLVTHGFTPRYVISSEIGAVAALAVAVNAWSKHSRALQLALFALVLVRFGMNVNANRLIYLSARADIAHTLSKIEQYSASGLPIAMAEVTVFHKLSFYGPPDLKQKIFYLLDPDTSVRYLGHDTIERGLADLKPWFHENAVPYSSFVSQYRDFYAYGYIGSWTWMTYRLVDDRLVMNVVERDGDRLMLEVHNPSPTTD